MTATGAPCNGDGPCPRHLTRDNYDRISGRLMCDECPAGYECEHCGHDEGAITRLTAENDRLRRDLALEAGWCHTWRQYALAVGWDITSTRPIPPEHAAIARLIHAVAASSSLEGTNITAAFLGLPEAVVHWAHRTTAAHDQRTPR